MPDPAQIEGRLRAAFFFADDVEVCYLMIFSGKPVPAFPDHA